MSVAGSSGEGVVLGLGAKQLAVAIVVGGAALMVVGGALAGTYYFVLGEDGGADLALVPAGSDTVTYVDVDQATSDRGVRRVVDTWLELEPGSADSMEEVLANFENETGLDPDGLHHATAFSRYEESTGAGATDYSATIVRTDWSEGDVVAAIESDGDATLAKRTYRGVTVYAPTDVEGTAAADSWVAVLGDGTYVVGTENATRDVVDVKHDEGDALGGELKSAFQGTRSGYVRFAVTVPERRLPTGRSAAVDTSKYREVSMLSGAYYTGTGKLGLEMTMHAESESAAGDIADVTEGGLSLLSGTTENEELEATLRDVEVSRDGDDVSITYENSVDDVQELVKALDETAGSDGGSSGAEDDAVTGVQAGATVQPDAAADEVAVTWTSNQNADGLRVRFDSPGGPDDTARLSELGDSYTYEGADGSRVTVTVTAVGGDERVVVVEKVVEL